MKTSSKRRLKKAWLSAAVFLATLAATAISLQAAHAQSAKLLMFEEQYCSWCKKWDDEIGGIYHLTSQSCHAALNRVPITEKLPDAISLSEPIIYTPTFVLIYENKETGRITGYPGEDFFWSMLDDLIASVPTDAVNAASKDCEAS